MERRNARRKLTETRVIVHHDTVGAAPLRTRDMSQSGVFVSTAQPVRLKAGTTFDLTFMINLGAITKLRKVCATVVQSTPEGLGLRFRSETPL